MNEEEKKAIEIVIDFAITHINDFESEDDFKYVDIAKKVIETQKAEIEDKKEKLRRVCKECNKEELKNRELKAELEKYKKENHDLKEKLQMYIPRRRVRRVYKMIGKILRTDISPELLEKELKKELVEGEKKDG